MELVTAVCTLRPFEKSDANSIARHANNRAIWLNLRDQFAHPYTRADAEDYIAHVRQKARLTNFAIVVGGEAIGSVGMRPGQDVERLSAEIGYWLGEPFWGRGIVTAAVRAATDYAFGQLGLVRLFAVPYANNAASARVLEKAGYQREGVMRSSAIKDGKILDQFLYAAIRG